MTNILIALKNIANHSDTDIGSAYSATGRNRANNMGEALENYVKDSFCNTFGQTTTIKNETYSERFSYLGNQNNPPDIIIKGGDAIEVKKIESVGSQIALNSSYPKDKLYADSPMITQECKDCEEWDIKDIIYVIGATPEDRLKALWLVYGTCYSANKEVYEKVKTKISEGVNSLPNVEFSETKELGRVNKVDPLGITYLRIRGMWGIDNPLKVFDYLNTSETDNELEVNAVIPEDKYINFPEADRNEIENMEDVGLFVEKVKIKSPNNPAKLLDAYHIKYSR